MKIIKDNFKINNTITCWNCKSELEFELSDVSKGPGGYQVYCPLCKMKLYITDWTTQLRLQQEFPDMPITYDNNFNIKLFITSWY